MKDHAIAHPKLLQLLLGSEACALCKLQAAARFGRRDCFVPHISLGRGTMNTRTTTAAKLHQFKSLR